MNKNVEEILEETRLSDRKFGSDSNVFNNLEKEDGDESKSIIIENKPIRESIIGEMIVEDKPLDEFDFSKENDTDDDEEEEESDQEFEELEGPPQIEERSDDENYESEESDDDLSEIPEVDEEAEEAQEFMNEDSEGASDDGEDGGDGFEEFTEHEIEASVNLNREIDSCSENDEQDILVIEEVTPEGRLERSFSTNARSIQFSVSEAEDDTNSITQSYRQHHDWDSLLNRSYERDERLLSISHMSHASHMSHVSEVSKMSEKELLDSIDIDTVLVETTEYVTEEIDPQTSNVTVVTHTTFTEVRRTFFIKGNCLHFIIILQQ